MINSKRRSEEQMLHAYNEQKHQIPAPGTLLTQLDNGLVIIVREDHTAPVVFAKRAASIRRCRRPVVT